MPGALYWLMRKAKVHCGLAVLLAASAAPGAPDDSCAVLPASQQKTWIEYVQKKYRLPADVVPRLAEDTVVPGTCYRKLRFEGQSPTAPFSVTLYASSDGRFLTTELMDTQLDPVVEARERNQQTALALSQGARFATGPAQAPVTVVAFTDFQCPFCKRAAGFLDAEQQLPEGQRIRIIFRHFPLPRHTWAHSAAKISTCAGFQSVEAFWRLHDYIFEHQATLTADNLSAELEKVAQGIGRFDSTAYKQCVNDDLAAGVVMRDIGLGTANGVRFTPTIFVNGQNIGSPKDQESVHAAILEALQATKQPTP